MRCLPSEKSITVPEYQLLSSLQKTCEVEPVYGGKILMILLFNTMKISKHAFAERGVALGAKWYLAVRAFPVFHLCRGR